MKRLFTIANKFITSLKDYINTRLDILKLSVAEKGSMILAMIISRVLIGLFFSMALLFGSFAGAYALSDWLGPRYIGFLIVAAFYVIIGIILWLNHEKLIRVPIMNGIIRQLFKNESSKHTGKNP